MLRCLPGALDPGPRPCFNSPADVVAWAATVDWIVDADRAVVLHLGSGGSLTCVATCHSRLHAIGSLARDEMAAEARTCNAAAIVAVDVRARLPASGPGDADRRRHHRLRHHLALHAVALLDTVIVSRTGGVSVTGVLTYPLGGGLSWLQIHLPDGNGSSAAGSAWAHQDAAVLPLRPVVGRRGPGLWDDGDTA